MMRRAESGRVVSISDMISTNSISTVRAKPTEEGLEASQNDLVYSRAIAPFWDLQAGIAYDKNSDDSRTWGEIAIAGLAPYFFEARAALLLNSEGNIGLRLDLEYEALITQKLILTPSLEADFYTKDDPVMRTGSGLSSMEAGLRLRYEIIREFAPYIGVNWSRTVWYCAGVHTAQ